MPRDDRIACIAYDARAQHGVFTLAQALTAGYSRATVRRRLDCGEWHEVAPRVYRVAIGDVLGWRAATMACVLAVDGAACRASALALHGLLGPPPRPEVVVVRTQRTSSRPSSPSTNALPAADLTVVDGIAATTPARSLIDTAARLPRALFEDLLDTAIVRRVVTVDRLRARSIDLWAPRRNGCAIVLELLDQRDPMLHRAANVWEAKVLRVVRRLGMPQPEVNHRVRVGGRTRYLDLAWPAAKVAVEFDGFVPHSTRRVFDDDRARQNDLVAAGWTVFRITKAMLGSDLEMVFAPIASAIAASEPPNGSDAFRI